MRFRRPFAYSIDKANKNKSRKPFVDYLSKAINKNRNKTFVEFINEYRVTEAKRLLCGKEIEFLTIEAIGLEAGFNSKSTFFRVFKQQTGVTPQFFMKNINQNS